LKLDKLRVYYGKPEFIKGNSYAKRVRVENCPSLILIFDTQLILYTVLSTRYKEVL
jgi:hypothetical protein